MGLQENSARQYIEVPANAMDLGDSYNKIVDFLTKNTAGINVLFLGIGGYLTYKLMRETIPTIVANSMKEYREMHSKEIQTLSNSADKFQEKIDGLCNKFDSLANRLDSSTAGLKEASRTAANNFKEIENTLVFTNNQLQGIDSSVDTLTGTVMKQEILLEKIKLHVEKKE